MPGSQYALSKSASSEACWAPKGGVPGPFPPSSFGSPGGKKGLRSPPCPRTARKSREKVHRPKPGPNVPGLRSPPCLGPKPSNGAKKSTERKYDPPSYLGRKIRHPGCLLPVTWRICVAVAKRCAGQVTTMTSNRSQSPVGALPSPTGSEGCGRPSN